MVYCNLTFQTERNTKDSEKTTQTLQVSIQKIFVEVLTNKPEISSLLLLLEFSSLPLPPGDSSY